MSSGQNVSSREAKKRKVSPCNTVLTHAHSVGSDAELTGWRGSRAPTELPAVPTSVMARTACCQRLCLLHNVRDPRAETISQSVPSARPGPGAVPAVAC